MSTQRNMRASYFIPIFFSASLAAAEAPAPYVETPTPEHFGAELRMIAQWNEARALVKQQQYAAAVRNYHNVFTYSRGVATLALARLSILPAEVVELAATFPPAEQMLRDEIRVRAGFILTNIASTDEIIEFVALNRALGQATAILQIYDQLKNMGERMRDQRLRMRAVILEELIDAGRATEVSDATVSMARSVARRIDEVNSDADWSGSASPAREAYVSALRASVVPDGVRAYGALLVTGHEEIAARMAKRLTDFNARAETWDGLVRSAVQANRRDAAQRLVDDAARKLGADETARLRGLIQMK